MTFPRNVHAPKQLTRGDVDQIIHERGESDSLRRRALRGYRFADYVMYAARHDSRQSESRAVLLNWIREQIQEGRWPRTNDRAIQMRHVATKRPDLARAARDLWVQYSAWVAKARLTNGFPHVNVDTMNADPLGTFRPQHRRLRAEPRS